MTLLVSGRSDAFRVFALLGPKDGTESYEPANDHEISHCSLSLSTQLDSSRLTNRITFPSSPPHDLVPLAHNSRHQWTVASVLDLVWCGLVWLD